MPPIGEAVRDVPMGPLIAGLPMLPVGCKVSSPNRSLLPFAGVDTFEAAVVGAVMPSRSALSSKKDAGLAEPAEAFAPAEAEDAAAAALAAAPEPVGVAAVPVVGKARDRVSFYGLQPASR